MNHQSSIGLTEETLNTLMNAVAFEYHQKINHDKFTSILKYERYESEEERLKYEDLLNESDELLRMGTEFRRNTMRILTSLSDEENDHLWCSVKHIAEASISAFESWQVDLDNETLRYNYDFSVQIFNYTISSFLGFAPVPCSACFADMMQNKEQMDEIKAKAMAKLEKNNESVSKGNTSKS